MNSQLTLDKFQINKVKPDQPTLIIGDAIDIMNKFPKNTIDLIIDDIGYNDLEEHRQKGTTTRLTEKSGNEWYAVREYKETIPIYSKLLKRGRHMYIWRPSFNMKSLQNWVELIDPQMGLLSTNDFVLRKIIPCFKNYRGMGYSWNSQHEMIVYCIKHGERDARQLNSKDMKDYFLGGWKHPTSKEKIHTSEKPTEVYRDIILNSSQPLEIILEPFAGSFQCAFANTKFTLGRRIIGIEIDPERAKITANYFKKETKRELNVITFK